jgi:hypothetical protein
MNDKVMASPTSKKKYKTWVKSSRNDEWTKEIRVEEIENGFLVCLDEYGERKGKYESIYKKYFAKENPLSEDDLKLDDGLDKAIDNFVNNM